MRNSFIYTQTRLQARHGMRPDENTWQLVESHNDLANFLQSARRTRLGSWTTGLQASEDCHFLEAALIEHYRDYVKAVAAFVPPSWRKAVNWVNCLIYLPAIQHLLSGNTAYRWMLDDPELKQFTVASQDQRISYFLQSKYAPLIVATQSGKTLLTGWLHNWQSLWPDKKTYQCAALKSLISLLTKHTETFPQLSPTVTWRQREELANRLTMMFRRNAFHPVVIFIHLLLVALDIERLRAAVMQLCLFPKLKKEDV
jgi:hypothetical protein